ncbi:RxLR effector protein [Phytophthora megakarya]|uniref:RxLR effector protein n=1 Tax=Phytophthora megakarya TaxID=4795 RepID=A0A225VK11_9STRA|nr:RxLR effector protein [Phytophthora megakarya]
MTRDWTMLSTLPIHYKEDVLILLLISAMKIPSTPDLAIKLQAEQLRVKYKNGESSGDVFNLLQLNKAGNKNFYSSEFPVWSKYVRRGRQKISSTENSATQLQAEQLQIWLRKRKSGDDVFALLQLNKVDDKLFGIPEMALWSKYIDDLEISNKEPSMLSIFKTHNSEEAMIKLVNSPKVPLGMKTTVTGVAAGKMKERFLA